MYYKSRKEGENSFFNGKEGGLVYSTLPVQKIWFVNVCGKLLRRPSVGDRHTIDVLCRSNLDIFWRF